MASYELLRNIERRYNTANVLLRAINFGERQQVQLYLALHITSTFQNQFQKQHGLRIAEYAKQVGVNSKKLPFLGASNCFTALLSRESGFFQD